MTSIDLHQPLLLDMDPGPHLESEVWLTAEKDFGSWPYRGLPSHPPVIPGEEVFVNPRSRTSGDVWGFMKTPILAGYDWKTRVVCSAYSKD